MFGLIMGLKIMRVEDRSSGILGRIGRLLVGDRVDRLWGRVGGGVLGILDLCARVLCGRGRGCISRLRSRVHGFRSGRRRGGLGLMLGMWGRRSGCFYPLRKGRGRGGFGRSCGRLIGLGLYDLFGVMWRCGMDGRRGGRSFGLDPWSGRRGGIDVGFLGMRGNGSI